MFDITKINNKYEEIVDFWDCPPRKDPVKIKEELVLKKIVLYIFSF